MDSDFSFPSPTKTAAGRSTTRSQATSSLSTQILTPEKSAQPPRFPRGKGVVYSLNQVKKAAVGLRSVGREESGSGGVAVGGNNKVGFDSKRKRKWGGGSSDETRDAGGCSSSSVEEKVADGSRLPDLARKRLRVAKLPEKYELLEEFFKCMVRAIRLLRLKRQLCILSNISPQIESLTNRRFSHGHLAQLKYLLPEAIVVKKFNKLDDATCCMKPDLQIDLIVDAFVGNVNQKESGYNFLERTFRARLEKFYNDYPEGDDVPEDALPEPFGYTKRSMHVNITEDVASTSIASRLPETSNAVFDGQSMTPCHMPRSFKRWFSQKVSHVDKVVPTSDVDVGSAPAVALPERYTFRHTISSPEETIQCDDFPAKDTNGKDRTPVKVVSTPLRLMAVTPEPKTPKSCTVMDDGLTPVRKCVNRPLSYTEASGKDMFGENETDVEVYDASLGFLPKYLLQSVMEKERKSMEDQVAGNPEAKRRNKMIACLPKLFDIIHLIFQSAQRSVLTRQELVSKIITGHIDIVDKTEVEEQLNLLLEIVPEWITGETIFSGDNVLRVNKMVSPELMRQRLTEAK